MNWKKVLWIVTISISTPVCLFLFLYNSFSLEFGILHFMLIMTLSTLFFIVLPVKLWILILKNELTRKQKIFLGVGFAFMILVLFLSSAFNLISPCGILVKTCAPSALPDRLPGSIVPPEPEFPATENEPIIFNKEIIIGKIGRPLGFTVNVFNPNSESVSNVTVSIKECSEDNIDNTGVISAPQTMSAKSSTMFRLYVRPKKSIDSIGSKVCVVEARALGLSRNITFNITE